MRVVPILIALFLFGCRVASPTWVDRPEIGRVLSEEGVTGVVVLFDPQKAVLYTNDRERAHTRYLPASTYKIFNSLVALESEVIADENETIAWDGVDRGWKSWNRDHSMRSAFRVSALWFYEELARRTGKERMQHHVDAVGYGNRDISGESDHFWLDGRLRISPVEQIDLLVRLRSGDLPFSENTMAIVRDIMVLEEEAGGVLRGKSGWADGPSPMVGWFVGYVERESEVYYVATEIDILTDEDASKRRRVTDRVLSDLGVWAAPG